MPVLQAIILGLVQGVAEFLPISSSGHLVLAQHLFGWTQSNLPFDVLLHTATLLAILVFFWKDILSLSKQELFILLVGSIPAGLVGIIFEEQLTQLFSSVVTVGAALVLTGLINIVTSYKLVRTELEPVELKPGIQPGGAFTEAIGPGQAVGVGAMQALAVIPGISRSGATIFGGTMLGLQRKNAFTLSFLLSVPAIVGATILQLIKVKPDMATSQLIPTVAGCVAAFIAGLASLALFKYVMKHSRLDIFGYYCLVVGAATIIFL